METFLTWIELSALGRFMRDSGAWTYPIVNLVHVVGVASLFGSVLVVDLALLGVWPRQILPPIARTAPSVTAAGLLLAAVSGVGLLASNATEYRGNLFFLIKFPLIAGGVANAVLIRRSAAWKGLGYRPLTVGEERGLAMRGGLSLTCWLLALAAGRLIAYW